MQKIAKILWAVVAVLVVVLVIVVATRGEKAPGSETKKPIKIGVSLPLTGEAASYGEACIGGAELAAKEINDMGGINGRLVELVIEDDQCNATGVTVFNKLVNIDKVVGIVGPACSAAAGPALPIAQEGKTPTIVIGSAPDLTKTGDFIFRNYPSDATQGKSAAEFVYNNLLKKKIAVLFTQNDWGQGIRNVFVSRFKELGGEVVFDEGVAPESKDIKTQLAKIKNTNAEALYFSVYPTTAVAGLKQVKEMGLDIAIIGGDTFAGEDIIQTPEAEGAIYTLSKTNNPEDFQAKIKELRDANTIAFTPFYYDAVKILAEAIEKAGTDPEALKEELTKTSYRGVAVPLVEFDSNGDLKDVEFDVQIIKDGKSVEYQQ